MIWADKQRPGDLASLDFHPELTTKLQVMAKSGEFPHLVLYGPSGSGKKTRVMAFLQEIFGPGVHKMKLENRTFKFDSPSRTLEIATVSSVYHIEVNPSDVGHHDRLIVQALIKEIAQSRPIESATAGKPNFKVVVLNEVERLTREAQHALRRTMEKYIDSCRLILLCNNLCKIISPLRSRCLCVRVPAPSEQDIVQVLEKVANREGLRVPEKLCERIADYSKRNARRALLTLEAMRVAEYPFRENQPIVQLDWEKYIEMVAKKILQDQSNVTLMEVRSAVYELLVNCIPPDVIVRYLAAELKKKVDQEIKQEITKWAAYYEHRMQQGSKPIFHIEAFVAKVMLVYKQYLASMSLYD